MSKVKRYMEFCTGCGLCESIHGVQFEKKSNGFRYPVLENEDVDFCNKVCPSGGSALKQSDYENLWGRTKRVYLGWSNNELIRQKASTGGILTSIAYYLLNEKMVDGIIHTCRDEKKPWSTTTIISRTDKEVISRCGSRYAESSPLSQIRQLIIPGETYAFIGKPCDVSALRLYMKDNISLKKQIPYLLSFFCAGVPSEEANIKLIEKLGAKDINDCTDLQYRGSGWPGYATLITKSGNKNSMSYEDSWGKILGRDIRKSCRFCVDGIGEMADIACGDAWYLTEDMKPDFAEGLGRNVIFGRNEKAIELLNEMQKKGLLILKEEPNIVEELKYSQTYQYERRATMFATIYALKLFGKTAPKYDVRILKKYAHHISLQKIIRRFLGTCKRIIQGKI